MNILFDHQIFVYQNYGGISRYFYELINNLKSNPNAQVTIDRYFSENSYLKEQENKIRSYSLLNGKFPGRMTVYNSLNKLLTIKQLLKEDYDIFHPTYFDDYYLKYVNKKPFVITIYDMIHELYPGFWPDQNVIIERKAKLMHLATGIIAISENTKKDILKLYPSIPESKIKVIYLANSLQRERSSVMSFEYNNFLLFVGNRPHYKNFKNLLLAFKTINGLHPDIKLICAGGGAFTDLEKKQILELNLIDQVKVESILDDNKLCSLYSKAKAFVFPSLYEGFGIPILEAFSMECPVILSRSSCFEEIAGEAAEYFDGNNPADIASTICSLLDNPNRLNNLKKLGGAREKLFSWSKTTSETLNFYSIISK